MSAAKPRGILFAGPMVRAILDGRKTVTRRVVSESARLGYPHGEIETADVTGFVTTGDLPFSWRCPYPVGALLWVRETWAWSGETASRQPGDPVYRADGPGPWEWRPSIFMPRWASRIALRVKDVRVERLQSVNEADAIAEGIDAKLFAELLAPLAAKAKTRPLHWIGGADDGEYYCRKCCEKQVRKLKRAGDVDAFVDGGWGTEEDGQRWCADCAALLDHSLTDYGVEAELEALEEACGVDAEFAHIASCVLGVGGNPLLTESCADFHYKPEWKGRVARLGFQFGWDLINGKRPDCSWDSNPLVWRIEFEVVPA